LCHELEDAAIGTMIGEPSHRNINKNRHHPSPATNSGSLLLPIDNFEL